MPHTANRLCKAIAARAGVPAICAAALVLTARPAYAAGPTVSGAGSTWVQIALDQWRADIARQGYSINYQGNGSSAGRSFYINGQVDFAASEIPFQPDEIPQVQSVHRSYQYVPDVAGGTSLMYNLHTPSGGRVTSLRLDAVTAGRIFTGDLTSWQDPAIQALNPGLQISESRITAVIRSDGSGTSAQFSLYLADQASAVWNAFVNNNGCPAPCSQWPPFTGSTQQKGSDGVANFVANDAVGSGAIGYVEAGYAYGRDFPVANLRNASGNFVQPIAGNVATALTHATLHSDLTQDLTNVYRAPEQNAYPMSSYSYLITQTDGFDPAKGAVLGTWMIYIACGGQREAAPLGYSPLPRNLVQDVFDGVSRIPGAPTPPPIDAAHCPNPTITGEAIANGPVPGGGASDSTSGGANSAGSSGSTSGGARSGGSSGGKAGTRGGAAASGGSGAGTASGTDSAAGDSGTSTDNGDSGATLPSGVSTISSSDRQALAAQAAAAVSKENFSPAAGPLILAAVAVAALFAPMAFRQRPQSGGEE